MQAYRVKDSILQQCYEIEQNRQRLQRDSQAYASNNANRPTICSRIEDLRLNDTRVIQSDGFLWKNEQPEERRDMSKYGKTVEDPFASVSVNTVSSLLEAVQARCFAVGIVKPF